MNSNTDHKIAYMIFFIVISVAVVGYFVGLQSPMNPAEVEAAKRHIENGHAADPLTSDDQNLKATDYSKMAEVLAEQKAAWRTRLSELNSTVNLHEPITITLEEKRFALAMREQNRAFNGAPPTIPHPIDQKDTQSCMACHGEGAQTATLRIPKMSHQFLANCTQCHVESNPTHQQGSEFKSNTFVGLPAPEGGPRAFPLAPPMIPHTTWMRVDCMSCHGTSGQHGIRTTHPWRKNCTQCHAPSSKLDQLQTDSTSPFLPPPSVKN